MTRTNAQPRNRTDLTVTRPRKLYPDYDLRFGTWNVRTLSQDDSLLSLIQEVERYGLEIVALQELRRRGIGIHQEKDHTLFYSEPTTKSDLGVGFLVGRRMAASVINFTAVNARVCTLRVRGRFYNITFVCVHSPTEVADDVVKDDFYDRLEELLSSLPGHDAKVVLGDFNAQIGNNPLSDGFVGRCSIHDAFNNNGQRLSDFAISSGLAIASTYFTHKPIHLGTWRSPLGTVSQIDHVLVDVRHFSSIMDVRTYRGADIGSDHFLVGGRFRWRISRAFYAKAGTPGAFNTEALQDGNVLASYQSKLEERIGVSDPACHRPPPDEHWTRLKDAIVETAKETLGERVRSPSKSWFDEECRKAVERRKVWYLKQLNERTTRSTTAAFKEARRVASRLCRRKKREWLKNRVEHIDDLGVQHLKRHFFREVRALTRGSAPRSSAIRNEEGDLQVNLANILDVWANYFDGLLNLEGANPPSEANPRIRSPTAEIPVDPPSYDEFQCAINRLKARKAPGVDGISAELITSGGEALFGELFHLVLSIWEREQMPDEWRTAILVPIHKKGDRHRCDNYRGIALLCSAYKVFSNILQARVSQYAEEIVGEYQCGFRPNRSTTDHIFTLRTVLSKCWELNISVHQLFVDFKAAYDSLSRERLWSAMEWMGVPLKLVSLCKMTVTNSLCRVKVESKLSRQIKVNSGVRQGDGLSPVLFNLALEYVVRLARMPPANCLYIHSQQMLAYADDVCIMGRNAPAVKEQFIALESCGNRIGLKVNSDKTKYMSTSRGGRRVDLVCGADNFEGVRSFKYLGSIVTEDNTETGDLESRVCAGNRAFYALKSLLKSKYMSTANKLKIYRTMVRPVVTFGCESWTLTAENERRLAVFERRVLRSIFGPVKLADGSYRIRYNIELRSMMSGPDIVGHIKASRIRWLGHVCRSEDGRMIKRALDSKPEGQRPRGRPRRGWLASVLNDVQQLDCRNWRSATSDRVRWRQVVEQAKSLHGT